MVKGGVRKSYDSVITWSAKPSTRQTTRPLLFSKTCRNNGLMETCSAYWHFSPLICPLPTLSVALFASLLFRTCFLSLTLAAARGSGRYGRTNDGKYLCLYPFRYGSRRTMMMSCLTFPVQKKRISRFVLRVRWRSSTWPRHRHRRSM